MDKNDETQVGSGGITFDTVDGVGRSRVLEGDKAWFLDRNKAEKPDPAKMKETNPKDIIGSSKLPLSLFPTTAIAMGCIGMLNGALKYGTSNYRVMGIRASIYIDALLRHVIAWNEGEECDPDDGVPHLAAALACLAILVDARAADKMVDDRKIAGGYHKLVGALTPHVPRLKALHAGKHPRHYSIADNEASPSKE
jgi:hypothetical protein